MDEVFLRDYPPKKLDSGSSGAKHKYFTSHGIDFTLATFLVLWLLRYVVDGRSHDGVNVSVFRLVTLQAHGRHMALGSPFSCQTFPKIGPNF